MVGLLTAALDMNAPIRDPWVGCTDG